MTVDIRLIMKEWRKRINKYRIIAGIVLFVALALLFVSSGSALREDEENFLSGEGAWELDFAGKTGYCQEFAPQYRHLQSIGIVLAESEDMAEEGVVRLLITDGADQTVAEYSIDCGQIDFGAFTDVDVDLWLKRNRNYHLTVTCDFKGEKNPRLRVCGTDMHMFENKDLHGAEEIPGAQLVTRYRYKDVLKTGVLMKALILALIMALGIMFGLPADNRVRTVVAVLLLLGGPYVLGQRLELMLPIHFLLPHAMKWNLGIMYLFEIVVLLCSYSKRFAIVFTNVFLTIVYSANYFVFAFRGNYLKINELAAAGTAAEVVGNYTFRPNVHMAMAWCILGVFIVYGMCTGRVSSPEEKESRQLYKRLIGRAATFLAGAVLFGIAVYKLVYTDMLLENNFRYFCGMEQECLYYFNGYLVGSMLDIKYSKIQPPPDYSVQRVREILAENPPEEVGSEERPHVIVVMNESWSDLRVLGNLQISRENFTFTNSLRENTVRGYANSSVLGGGTANAEFELLTGCSMGFLPASYYPYEQCVTRPLDSMVSNFEAAGYTTYSMHPEKQTNWRRNKVYDYFGFDVSLWQEDFAGAEIVHSGVSDLETYHKIEELYENRKDGEKVFIFDVTMQNHGYYETTNVDRTVHAENVSCEEADVYLSLVYETDRAFEQLIHYFEEQDEKVIVCMFGDHQPKFFDEAFYDSIARQTEGMSEIDRKLNQYKTPFVIWANYDIEEAEELDISMNYLGVLLQRTAGMQLTPYFTFLEKQMAEYPVITFNGYKTKDGTYHNWAGDDSEFSEYRMLQYNYLFDNAMVK